MSAEKDISLDEKRVFADKQAATEVYVATAVGLARVSISGDLVGQFGLAWRGTVRDVATADGLLAVATDSDVLVGTDLTETGFGAATAVGFDDGTLLAAGEGRIARYIGGEGWQPLGECADVRAIDGPFIAAADGLHRAVDGLPHVGLDDARDVSATGVPLAATPRACYYLGNGWMTAIDGPFHVVASDGDRAHAATTETVYARTGGEWASISVPVEDRIAGIAYADATAYLVTEGGVFLVESDEDPSGWTQRSLGLPGVRRVAVLA